MVICDERDESTNRRPLPVVSRSPDIFTKGEGAGYANGGGGAGNETTRAPVPPRPSPAPARRATSLTYP